MEEEILTAKTQTLEIKRVKDDDKNEFDLVELDREVLQSTSEQNIKKKNSFFGRIFSVKKRKLADKQHIVNMEDDARRSSYKKGKNIFRKVFFHLRKKKHREQQTPRNKLKTSEPRMHSRTRKVQVAKNIQEEGAESSMNKSAESQKESPVATKADTSIKQKTASESSSQLSSCGGVLSVMVHPNYDSEGASEHFLEEINVGNKIYKIESGDCLDVSYNKDISSDEFEKLGNFILSHKLTVLHAIDCDITQNKLQSFSGGLKDGKLKQLDISCSKNLTTEGFALLAKFILKHEVETLIVTSCEMTKNTLRAFCEPLIQESNKLKELDLSYNSTLEPDAYEIVSSLVVECEMTFLGLTGCKVTATHLIRLKFAYSTQINMDMSDNVFLGRGIKRLSEIANECQLKELNISDCMITTNQLRLFREGLKETKICRIHLSDYDRRPGEEYIREVCKLLPYITEVLYVQFKSLSTHCENLLQDKLDMQTEKNTKIILLERTIAQQEKRKRNT